MELMDIYTKLPLLLAVLGVAACGLAIALLPARWKGAHGAELQPVRRFLGSGPVALFCWLSCIVVAYAGAFLLKLGIEYRGMAMVRWLSLGVLPLICLGAWGLVRVAAAATSEWLRWAALAVALLCGGVALFGPLGLADSLPGSDWLKHPALAVVRLGVVALAALPLMVWLAYLFPEAQPDTGRPAPLARDPEPEPRPDYGAALHTVPTRWALAASLLAVVMAFGCGRSSAGLAAKPQPPSVPSSVPTLEIERLVIKDRNGQVRFQVELDASGNPTQKMFDAHGKQRVTFGISTNDDSVFALCGLDGSPRVASYVQATGQAGVGHFDEHKKLRIHSTLGSDGIALESLLDTQGRARYAVSSRPDGSIVQAFSAPNGNIKASTTVHANGEAGVFLETRPER